MILYLTTAAHGYTMASYLVSRGAPLRHRMRLATYDWLFRTRALPAASYIFSDLERLSPGELEQAAAAWASLAGAGRGLRLLNHPLRVMRRYELLRSLHTAGLNDFNVYRLTDNVGPARYPVFLRGENDHDGSLTPLLHTPDELAAAIRRLVDEGRSREDKIITEFCNPPTADGLYRTYGAQRIGDRILPRHLFYDGNWSVKLPRIVDQAKADEEHDFVATNPHGDALMQIFQHARIEYGRVDYTVVNGRIQVFEINTNPVGPFSAAFSDARRHVLQEHAAAIFLAALEAIDHPGAATPPIPRPPAPRRRRSILWPLARLRQIGETAAFRVAGLGHLLPLIRQARAERRALRAKRLRQAATPTH